MKITEIPLAALRLQYRIARAPLRLFEQRVLTRVDSEAPGRLLYERSVGVVDAAVGNALGDPEVGKRGVALVERSEALGEATGSTRKPRERRSRPTRNCAKSKKASSPRLARPERLRSARSTRRDRLPKSASARPQIPQRSGRTIRSDASTRRPPAR